MGEFSEEDFSRFQNQLLELREKNYSLEDKLRKQSKELASLTEQCSRQSSIIRASKSAVEAENLSRDNNVLRSRLRDQEEDFKLQNSTLLEELSRLVSENENLERQMRELCQGISGEVTTDASTDDSKQVVLLRTELSLQEKRAKKVAVQYSEEVAGLQSKITVLTQQNSDLQRLVSQHALIQDEGAINLKDGGVSFKKLSVSNSENSALGEQEISQQEVHQLKEKLQEKDAAFIVLKEQHQVQLRTSNDKLLAEMGELKERVSLLASKVAEQEHQLAVTAQHNQQMAAQLDEAEQDSKAAHTELNRANTTIADYSHSIQELQQQVSSLLSDKQAKEELVSSVQQQRDAFSEQLESLTAEKQRLAKSRDKLQKTVEEKRNLILEMKEHIEKLEKQEKETISNLEEKSKEEKEQLKAKLKEKEEVVKALKADLAGVEPIRQQLEELQREKMMAEEKVAQVEEELSSHRDFWQVEKEKIEAEALLQITDLKAKHSEERSSFNTELEISAIHRQELEEKVNRLDKQLSDAQEEKLIQERRGLTLLKDVKKQVSSERKRADKLQDKLSQLLADPSLISGFSATISEAGDDVSSVSSWSLVSGEQRNADVSTSAPQSPGSSHSCGSETAELLARVASLQQTNWQLEEQIQHLEASAAAMAQDLLAKSSVIQHYCLQASPAPPPQSLTPSKSMPSSPQQGVDSPGAGVRRMLSRIKEVGGEVAGNLTASPKEEALRDTARRLQAMLEETLLKNLNLHKDVENLTQQVKGLTELLAQERGAPGDANPHNGRGC